MTKWKLCDPMRGLPSILGRLSLAGALVGAVAAGCGGYSHTVRIVEGERIEGRAISPDAYAAYLGAAQLEARGDAHGALQAYEIARSRDSNSVEIQSRIAKLTCQLHPDAAREPFEDAIELDATYEGAWREWALCELRRGNLTRALRMAKRAVRFAPSSLSATSAVAAVYEARKEPDLAIRQLVAYVTLYPHSRAAWRELTLTARRQNDRAWEHTASLALTDGRPQSAPSPDDALALIAAELASNGLDGARPLAVEYGVSTMELAWLALEVGQPKAAARQAELILGATPNNVEAAILALAAHHQAGTRSGFRRQLEQMPPASGALSDRGVVAMASLVRELAGERAAAAFLEGLEAARRAPSEPASAPPPPPASDVAPQAPAPLPDPADTSE